MAAPGMVEIPIEEYDQLLKDSEWLGWLESAGVDNWDGCDIAHQLQADYEEQNLEA